jgi:hypothetical protein
MAGSRCPGRNRARPGIRNHGSRGVARLLSDVAELDYPCVSRTADEVHCDQGKNDLHAHQHSGLMLLDLVPDAELVWGPIGVRSARPRAACLSTDARKPLCRLDESALIRLRPYERCSACFVRSTLQLRDLWLRDYVWPWFASSTGPKTDHGSGSSDIECLDSRSARRCGIRLADPRPL